MVSVSAILPETSKSAYTCKTIQQQDLNLALPTLEATILLVDRQTEQAGHFSGKVTMSN